MVNEYENIFAKGYVPNLSKEVFVSKKVKNTASLAYVVSDLNGAEVVETFYQKEL